MKKNKVPGLKGSYKYKRIMRRYGKHNNDQGKKIVRKKEIISFVRPSYPVSSTMLSPVIFEYSYISPPDIKSGESSQSPEKTAE